MIFSNISPKVIYSVKEELSILPTLFFLDIVFEFFDQNSASENIVERLHIQFSFPTEYLLHLHF